MERIRLPPTKTEAEMMKVMRDLLTGGAHHVGKGFKDPDDDWQPIWLVAQKDAGTIISGDLHKHDMTQMVSLYARNVGAIGVGTVQSAWMVGTGMGMSPERAREAQAYMEAHGGETKGIPERVEVVMVALYTATAWEYHMARIFRRKRRPPRLGPFEKNLGSDEGKTHTSGAMVDPIQQALRRMG